MLGYFKTAFRQVRELLQANHLSQLEKVLSLLKDLTCTPSGNTRKGGLIGLAAAAIALGKVIKFLLIRSHFF